MKGMIKVETSTTTSNQNAYLAATTYALIIGFSFLLIKVSLTVTNAIDILAYRFTVAFLFALCVNLYKKDRQKITLKDVRKILPIAIFYPTCFFLFQVIGLIYISTSEAGILQATIPIFTLILATFIINEKSSLLGKISIFLSVAGVMYIFIMSGINVKSYNVTGIIFILLSTLSIAFYNVFARSLTRKYPLFTLTYFMTCTGCIIFNTIAIGNHLINGSLSSFFLPLASGKFIFSIIYLGILSSFLTSFLSNYALNNMETSRMSVFNNIAILVTIIVGIIFLNETIYYYHIIGAIVIIAGVFGTNYTRKPRPRPQHPNEKNTPSRI